jgi:predicted tellurium resistance membrane protein TerC
LFVGLSALNKTTYMFFFLLTMPDFSNPSVWIGLLTLTFLEIVLGVDNIIFLSIISSRLDEKDQPKARNIGLILAMALRIILLFGISWLISLQDPLFTVNFLTIHGSVTGQGLILFLGGLFLLYKATSEIHHKLEGDEESDNPNQKKVAQSLNRAIIQIALINIVFSFDSILTAVGMTTDIVIMILSVIISMGIMMIFAGPVSKFVIAHPTVQMLGLSFLILIGFSLIAEAGHLGHFIEGSIPKGYLYFAIFFSLFVEILNLRLRKKAKPVVLHGPSETANKEGLIDEKFWDGK